MLNNIFKINTGVQIESMPFLIGDILNANSASFYGWIAMFMISLERELL